MPPGMAPPPGMPLPPGMPVPPGVPAPPATLGLPAPPASSAPAPPPQPALPTVDAPLRAWVGKFPEDMDDGTLQRIMDIFGTVRMWKRGADPDTQETKGFAFVQFGQPEALLNAVRVLHGLPVSHTHSFVVKVGASLLTALSTWHTALRKAQAEEAKGGEEEVEEGEAAVVEVALEVPSDVSDSMRWVWRVTEAERKELDVLGGRVVDVLRAGLGGGRQAGDTDAQDGRRKMESLKALFSQRVVGGGAGDTSELAARQDALAAEQQAGLAGNSGADVHMPVIDDKVVSAIDAFRETAASEATRKQRERIRAARERARAARAQEAQQRERSRSPPPGSERAGRGGTAGAPGAQPGAEARGGEGERVRRGGGRYDRPRDARFEDEDSDEDEGAVAGAPATGTATAASSAARKLKDAEPISIAFGGAGAADAPAAASGGDGQPLPPPPTAYSGWLEYPLTRLWTTISQADKDSELQEVLAPLVQQQLTELLGEADETMTTFIMNALTGGLPKDLESFFSELELVLEEDAGELVATLLSAVHGVASTCPAT